MNKFLKLLMSGVVGLVVLPACGQTEATAPAAASVNEAAPVAEPETAVIEVEVAVDNPVLEESVGEETIIEVVVEEVEAAIVEPVLEESTGKEPAIEAAVVEEPVAPERDLSDLSYVVNTGRPQFLNSFANW